MADAQVLAERIETVSRPRKFKLRSLLKLWDCEAAVEGINEGRSFCKLEIPPDDGDTGGGGEKPLAGASGEGSAAKASGETGGASSAPVAAIARAEWPPVGVLPAEREYLSSFLATSRCDYNLCSQAGPRATDGLTDSD